MRLFYSFLLCSIISISGFAQSDSGFRLEKISDNVYAIIADYGMGNSTVILGDESVIVADSHVSPELAKKVLMSIPGIEEYSSATLVNTHWHIDHVHGNSAYLEHFGSNLEIVATEETASLMRNESAAQLENWPSFFIGFVDQQKDLVARLEKNDNRNEEVFSFQQSRLNNLQLFLADMLGPANLIWPTITFSGDYTLTQGANPVELISTPGHTAGDIVVYLPDERILISGDVVLPQIFPLKFSPIEYIASLKAIEKLDINTIIPGHGDVLEGETHLKRMRQALESLVEQVSRGIEAGQDLETIQSNVNIAAYSDIVPYKDPTVQSIFELLREDSF